MNVWRLKKNIQISIYILKMNAELECLNTENDHMNIEFEYVYIQK